MRHDENDWSFQDTIQADSAALPSIPPFPDSSKDADNPLQWQVNLESATSQLFSNHCRTSLRARQLHKLYTAKGKLYHINLGTSASALSRILLIVLPSIIVTHPGCSPWLPCQQLNKFFSQAADHRGWFPNHWEPTDLSNEKSRWDGNLSETGYAADCFQRPL